MKRIHDVKVRRKYNFTKRKLILDKQSEENRV